MDLFLALWSVFFVMFEGSLPPPPPPDFLAVAFQGSGQSEHALHSCHPRGGHYGANQIHSYLRLPALFPGPGEYANKPAASAWPALGLWKIQRCAGRKKGMETPSLESQALFLPPLLLLLWFIRFISHLSVSKMALSGRLTCKSHDLFCFRCLFYYIWYPILSRPFWLPFVFICHIYIPPFHNWGHLQAANDVAKRTQ